MESLDDGHAIVATCCIGARGDLRKSVVEVCNVRLSLFDQMSHRVVSIISTMQCLGQV